MERYVPSSDLDATVQPASPAPSGDEPRSGARRRRRRGGGGGGAAVQAEAASTAAVAVKAPDQRSRPSGDNQQRRKSDGRPLAPRPWRDGQQRVVCVHHRTATADHTPIVHRTGLATRPLFEIDRATGLVLVCDGEHPGACEWPGEAAPIDRLSSLVVVARGDSAPVRAVSSASTHDPATDGDDLDAAFDEPADG